MVKKLQEISLYSAPARIGIFILCLLFFWLPIAALLYILVPNNRNLLSILTLGVLYLEFIILLKFWGEKVYNQKEIFKEYGLIWNRHNALDLLNGLAVGLGFCLGLFALMSLLGWITLRPPSMAPLKLVFEGLLSAIAIGFAEELLFRGWLLNELERDYSLKLALWCSALIYALLHFIKPLSEIIRTLVTFPALVVLGLTLVWGKRSHHNRLGFSIGLHSGLVWGYYIINVGKMLQYTNQVPTWVTGLDGNPLAGVAGLLFLGILASWMRQQANKVH